MIRQKVIKSADNVILLMSVMSRVRTAVVDETLENFGTKLMYIMLSNMPDAAQEYAERTKHWLPRRNTLRDKVAAYGFNPYLLGSSGDNIPQDVRQIMAREMKDVDLIHLAQLLKQHPLSQSIIYIRNCDRMSSNVSSRSTRNAA